MKPLILVAEDEAALAEMLRYNLEGAGFRVAEAGDGEQVLLAVAEEQPDLILLDWMLPRVSGIEICRRLRRRDETRDVPILMVTARAEERDRVRGLETGADDYITKPFSPSELLARVRAVLRRSRPALGASALAHSDLVMDLERHRVARARREVRLGPTEFRLLRHLLESPGRVYSRGQLLDAVWGRDADVEERTVDVHVRRLRRALNEGGEADLIRTVRGTGYALAPASA